MTRVPPAHDPASHDRFEPAVQGAPSSVHLVVSASSLSLLQTDRQMWQLVAFHAQALDGCRAAEHAQSLGQPATNHDRSGEGCARAAHQEA
jgi:hypothetical protein